ncbi:hypothetical protein [Cellulomonas sp. A375-1]|uniref:hypothetical protein n=1 Tax=Cellulomonas sp. A375-1 TaxID=1672219 RepID=UPI0012E32E17|nr:hypothetical protein [Cellulomonas sp. A375-1]
MTSATTHLPAHLAVRADARPMTGASLDELIVLVRHTTVPLTPARFALCPDCADPLEADFAAAPGPAS